MSGLLVDTNVISEARKGDKANPGVRAFWQETPPDQIYLAVQTVGELRCGLEIIRQRGDTRQARQLQTWLDRISSEFAGRILDFDAECAQVWGALMARRPQNPIDRQIAAIGLIHDLAVVTRNVEDFAGTGVQLTNPFS